MSEAQAGEARTAMVLAAGYGERMRPLTLTMPKPLVPLAGRPLINHVLDRLAQAGVKTAVVNVHYLPDLLEAHLAARKSKPPEIVISDERGMLLDTGGGAKKALPLLGRGPFFIHNAELGVERGRSARASPHVEAVEPGNHGLPPTACASCDQHRLWRQRRLRHGA